MSVKDEFNIKGLDSTLGYVGLVCNPASSDALLIQVLKRLGAVIIANTNLPQSIMVSARSLESVSWLLLTRAVVRNRESHMGADNSPN